MATSASTFTQALPQRRSGETHWKSQDDAAQVATAPVGAGHRLPHTLQFDEFVARSTQAPLQGVSPPVHDALQLPPVHTSPVPHAVRQLPQCFESDARSTQLPLQSVKLAAQA